MEQTLEEEIIITALTICLETIRKANRTSSLDEIIKLQIQAEGLFEYALVRVNKLPDSNRPSFTEEILRLTKEVEVLLQEQETGVLK